MGKRFHGYLAFTTAIMKFAIFAFYTFAFYIGSLYIQNGKTNSSNDGHLYSAVDVLTVLIALMTGFLGLLAALPSVQAV